MRYAKKESALWAKREKNGVEVTDHQFHLSSFLEFFKVETKACLIMKLVFLQPFQVKLII